MGLLSKSQPKDKNNSGTKTSGTFFRAREGHFFSSVLLHLKKADNKALRRKTHSDSTLFGKTPSCCGGKCSTDYF